MDPIPGESGFGYLCRIMHLTGHGDISIFHSHALGGHWPDHLRTSKSFQFASLLRVLRMRTDLSSEVAITKYSNFGVFRLFVDWDFKSHLSSLDSHLREPLIKDIQSTEMESSKPWSAPSWWFPLGVSNERIFYCRDCVRDQLDTHGFATWMSMHNFLEMKICHVHFKPLFSCKPRIGILPSFCTLKDSTKIEVKKDEFTEELNLSCFLTRLMNSSLPMISSTLSVDILKRHISHRHSRLTIRQRGLIYKSYLGHDYLPSRRIYRSHSIFRAYLSAAATAFDTFGEFERIYLWIAKNPNAHSLNGLAVTLDNENYF